MKKPSNRIELLNKVEKIWLEAGERDVKQHSNCIVDIKTLTKDIDALVTDNNVTLEHLAQTLNVLKQQKNKTINILRYLLGKCQRQTCKVFNSNAPGTCGVCKRVLLFLKDYKLNDTRVGTTEVSS